MAENKPYWQQRRDLKLKQPPTKKEERQKKQAKGVYFADQVQNAPKKCENCGGSLAGTIAINPAAVVAHILAKSEKSGCPSVALHPLNKFYACGDCHTNYDTKGAEFVQSMPIFPVLKERVAQFYDEIEPAERRRVPVYFKPHK